MPSPKRVLITGGAGNVGGSLARRLTERDDCHVVIVDSLLTGSRGNLPPRDRTNWTFIAADVNDYRAISAVMLSQQFDYVFHYAAVVGVKRTLECPTAVLRDIDGIRNVLELSKNTGVRRVFYSSSSEVYGEPVEMPQRALTTPLNSRLPYAIVKNVGEAFFRSYHEEYGLPFTIFRFFNTYGPRQSEDFVIPKFIRQALDGKPVTIYGDGSQTRTFCYIDDNLDTIEAIFDEGYAANTVINVGSDLEMSVKQLAEEVIKFTGSRSRLRHLPALAEGDMSRRCPDITEMRAILGRPLTSLRDGLAATLSAPQYNLALPRLPKAQGRPVHLSHT